MSDLLRAMRIFINQSMHSNCTNDAALMTEAVAEIENLKAENELLKADLKAADSCGFCVSKK